MIKLFLQNIVLDKFNIILKILLILYNLNHIIIIFVIRFTNKSLWQLLSAWLQHIASKYNTTRGITLFVISLQYSLFQTLIIASLIHDTLSITAVNYISVDSPCPLPATRSNSVPQLSSNSVPRLISTESFLPMDSSPSVASVLSSPVIYYITILIN